MPHTIVLLLENREKKRNTCKKRTDKQGKCVRHWNPETHGGLQGATWQLPQTMRIIILKLCSKFLFDISIFPLCLNSDSFFCSKKKNLIKIWTNFYERASMHQRDRRHLSSTTANIFCVHRWYISLSGYPWK